MGRLSRGHSNFAKLTIRKDEALREDDQTQQLADSSEGLYRLYLELHQILQDALAKADEARLDFVSIRIAEAIDLLPVKRS